MTDHEHLERSYRRLLAWYPRAFRQDKGQELLAVLLAGARDGQRRPGLAESADLIRGGLWMRLRPGVPGSARTVRAAVRFMYAGAMVSTVNLIILLALTVDITAYHAVLRYHLTAAQVSQFTTANATNPLGRSGIGLAIVSCAVQPALWLWMARANGQGGDWARRMSTQWFCFATLSLASVFPQSPLPRWVPAVHLSFVPLLGPILLVLTWLPGAAAVWLLWRPASNVFFGSPGYLQGLPGYLQAQHQAHMVELARIRSSAARWPRQL
jgi:hypothetical protein